MSAWQRAELSPGSWALRYASWSWKILPLHAANRGRCSCRDPECASPGKHPRTAHGVHDASRRPEQVRRWWATWPDANVAVATGHLVVVDVDGEQGHAALVALQTRHGRALPATPWAQTARGRHLYFLAPGLDIPNSSGRIGPGVDVRGAGGYVVAPPSRHASGRRYRWHGLHGGIAMLPHWLARELTTQPAINGPSTPTTVTVPGGYLRAALAGELERITAAPCGTRNDTLNRAAFRLGQLAAEHRDDPNARPGILPRPVGQLLVGEPMALDQLRTQVVEARVGAHVAAEEEQGRVAALGDRGRERRLAEPGFGDHVEIRRARAGGELVQARERPLAADERLARAHRLAARPVEMVLERRVAGSHEPLVEVGERRAHVLEADGRVGEPVERGAVEDLAERLLAAQLLAPDREQVGGRRRDVLQPAPPGLPEPLRPRRCEVARSRRRPAGERAREQRCRRVRQEVLVEERVMPAGVTLGEARLRVRERDLARALLRIAREPHAHPARGRARELVEHLARDEGQRSLG